MLIIMREAIVFSLWYPGNDRLWNPSMNTTVILQTLPTLPINDRLIIAETALKFILQEQRSFNPLQRKIQLMLAALTAMSDYQPGSDLLAFSELEGEDFVNDRDESEEVEIYA